MAEGGGNPGINKLARVISGRAKAFQDNADAALDFGVIQADRSLKCNSFPKPFPRGSYRVCSRAKGWTATTSSTEVGDEGEHDHTVSQSGISPGCHVLVAWVGNDPVVIDIITS